ncbi:MAG: ParB/RepB/Spo0J family partition protein [Rickettsiales bacterium]|nr:ParB/RepB/Spo0J family partition protein [Rickettsiales bacterium]
MEKNTSRLGVGLKGLSTFFDKPAGEGTVFEAPVMSAPEEFNPAAPVAEAPIATKNGEIVYIPIGNIVPNQDQPRRHFDEQSIRELAKSIQESGLLQPILVRKKSATTYEIVAGERRFRASQMATLPTVPAIVKTLSDKQSFEIGIIENVQRENLSPIEEGLGYKKLITDFSYTQEEVSNLVKKSRPYIANILRLLTLPAEVQGMIEKGEIPYTVARTLVGAKDPVAEAKAIVSQGLNAREAEKARGSKPKRPRTEREIDPSIGALQESIEKSLGVPVEIKAKGSKGEIVIRFANLQELDGLVSKLSMS